MAYFISHPSACRLYAKCSGWQETLTHFFVKTRRSSLAQFLPHRNSSQDVLSSYIKDPSLDSSQESSNLININDTNQQLTLILDLPLSPNDSSSEKQIEKLINETDDLDLTQTYVSPQSSLTANSDETSMNILTNNKDSTSDFPSYSNETIVTPPQSMSASRENLILLLKRENSNDNLVEMIGNDSAPASPLPQMTTSASTTQLDDVKESNEEHKRLNSLLREFLGWLIALVYSKIKALG
jgi:hypothetical protein